MIRIDIISAVPELIVSPLNTSIFKRSQQKEKVEIYIHNLRDYAFDKHRMIDDRPFGGEPGMVLKPEPFFECIGKLKSEREYEEIIFPSPKGKLFNQADANKLSLCKNLLFVAGHYKGIDERVVETFATAEYSIGNFILSGGELPALIIIDAIIRVIPGVLNDSESALNDSFQDGEMIAAPTYTRPAEYNGQRVPDILLTGNHGEIKKWKQEQSKELTKNWKRINKISE